LAMLIYFGRQSYHMVEKITNWKIRIIGLFRNNYTSSFYVREMAKLLGTTHVTLLPHLNALTKDKILTPNTIGRNKVFLLNLDNILAKDYIVIAEKFEANKFLEKTFLIKKIYNEIFKLRLEGSIVLFGSYVKGYRTEASDIDLFYLGDLNERQTEEMKKIGKLYGKQLNVKKAGLRAFESGLRSRDALTREIIKDHIIMQNPDLFVDTVWRYYAEVR